ncbi:hypothetical protein CFK38_04210 [Brachybacterium vulturis]|uniref:Peptidase C39-like domain-containing protein n=1 Tax=Brachybacterium vulturis TaxID=2017484 RepID=A0A291GLA3_9MICO|nr:twin-arginine translocation signal domain-containing protein [Brachybacterium vulturis]ATG50816.1 hypothetical protein CFK38_04210 [Brachybacterium vulturis]
MTSPLHTTLSRRTALRGLGVIGLAAAVGQFATSQAHAASDLVVIDQKGTGRWGPENCGPTSAVIALVAAGRRVEHYVSGAEGSARGGNARAVQEMRARCGLSPWGDPTIKTVDYTGAYLGDLETGIRDTDGTATRALYEEGLEAAAHGSVVILHVHHGRLLGEDADYGHFVVAQGEDAGGNILVSDPGRAQRIGITGYSHDHLLQARQGDSTIVS